MIMKKFAFMLMALVVSITTFAKKTGDESSYQNFYYQYKQSNDVITFKIPGSLASFFIDRDNVEAKELMKKIDDISFFIATDQTQQMIYDLNRSLPEHTYKTLMEVNDGDTEVTFLGKVADHFINEIIMAVYEPDNLVVMCINGDFTKEDARLIAKSINTDSAKNFRN